MSETRIPAGFKVVEVRLSAYTRVEYIAIVLVPETAPLDQSALEDIAEAVLQEDDYDYSDDYWEKGDAYATELEGEAIQECGPIEWVAVRTDAGRWRAEKLHDRMPADAADQLTKE